MRYRERTWRRLESYGLLRGDWGKGKAEVPCLCYNNVVEWRLSSAEPGKSDLDHHCCYNVMMLQFSRLEQLQLSRRDAIFDMIVTRGVDLDSLDRGWQLEVWGRVVMSTSFNLRIQIIELFLS
jgi:hypothetical protein